LGKVKKPQRHIEKLCAFVVFNREHEKGYPLSYPKNSGTGEGRSAFWNFDLSQVLDWKKKLAVGIGNF